MRCRIFFGDGQDGVRMMEFICEEHDGSARSTMG